MPYALHLIKGGFMKWILTILGVLFLSVSVIAEETEKKENPDFEKAYEHYNQAKYDEAIGLFEKVLKDDPNHLRAQVYYGVCFMGKEDFDRAITELEKALGSDPKFPLTNYALAVSYARKASPDAQKAENYLKSAKEYGYQVPVWFEQYVERLKTGNLPPQQEMKPT